MVKPLKRLKPLILLQISNFQTGPKSCFGDFMNLPNFNIQHQLIHNLLHRQLKQPNNHDIWIGVGGMKLKFEIEKFATLSRLRYVCNYDKMRFAKSKNNFVSTYYDGYNTISKSSVKKSFLSKEWKNDKDVVKMEKMYFLHHFLLRSALILMFLKVILISWMWITLMIFRGVNKSLELLLNH